MRITFIGGGNMADALIGEPRILIREGEVINAPALSAMVRQIIANNRAGGWRKLKPAL